MKYCIDWRAKSTILDKVDEINIDIINKEISSITEFAKEHKNQRINLCINDYEEGINEGYFKAALELQKENKGENEEVQKESDK